MFIIVDARVKTDTQSEGQTTKTLTPGTRETLYFPSDSSQPSQSRFYCWRHGTSWLRWDLKGKYTNIAPNLLIGTVWFIDYFTDYTVRPIQENVLVIIFDLFAICKHIFVWQIIYNKTYRVKMYTQSEWCW